MSSNTCTRTPRKLAAISAMRKRSDTTPRLADVKLNRDAVFRPLDVLQHRLECGGTSRQPSKNVPGRRHRRECHLLRVIRRLERDFVHVRRCAADPLNQRAAVLSQQYDGLVAGRSSGGRFDLRMLTMDALERDYSTVLLAAHEPPCLSLYQPTHRLHPDNQQDPIRFRNLVKTLEASLRHRHPERDIRPLLAPFHTLAGDRDFWNHTLDGLAVLATSGLFKVYRLQRPVIELAIVADTFHIKPLLRILQSSDRYQILGLNRHAMRLFEGNRDALDEVEPAPGVPRTIADVVVHESGEPERTIRAYGGTATPASTTRHGTNVKEDATDHETERFFRAVDRAVMDHHSHPSGLPLLLAALPEHHHLFRVGEP